MSENTVVAYFIERADLVRALGSNDTALRDKVLKDKSRILRTAAGRWDDDKALAKNVENFIAGKPHRSDDMLNGFAAWAIFAALADGQPENPLIEAPGLDTEEDVARWKKAKRYPQFRELLTTLEGLGSKSYVLPVPKAIATLPSFAFVDAGELGPLAKDAAALLDADDADWEEEVDAVAAWVLEAAEKKRSLLLVLDGDL